MVRPRFRPLAALSLALALVAGCQAPATPPTGTRVPGPPAPDAGPVGRVAVDLAAVRAAWGAGRRLQDASAGAHEQLSRLRLRVAGPGIGDPPEAETAWDGSVTGGTVGNLTLAVPAGPNRVFVIDGLNADGQVLRTIRGLGQVAADQALTVRVDWLADAAARTLTAMLAAPAGSEADLRTPLAAADVTTKLKAFVGLHVGFDSVANTYTGVDPVRFPAAALAAAVRAEGLAILDELAARPALAVASAATHAVTVRDTEGEPIAGAAVQVFAPRVYAPGAHATSDAAGSVTIADVPPGTWAAVALNGDRQVWGSLVSRASETDGALTLQFQPTALRAVSTLAGVRAAAPDEPFLTAAGIPIDGEVFGTAIDRVAVGPDGQVFYSTHGQLWRRDTLGATTRLARVSLYPGGSPFARITALEADREGGAYVGTTNAIYHVTATGTTTLFKTLGFAVGDLLLSRPPGAGGDRLYVARSGVGLYYLDPASPATLSPLYEVPLDHHGFQGFDSLAADTLGNVYATDANSNAIYKITVDGTFSILAGGAGVGDAVGDGPTEARFDGPRGLAFDQAFLYVADSNNHRIKRVALDGSVSNWMGDGRRGNADGLASGRLAGPTDLAKVPGGAVWLADAGNDALRSADMAGVATVSRFGAPPYVDAAGTNARFGKLDAEDGLAIGGGGVLYVGDRANNVIRRVGLDGAVSTWAGSGQARSYDGQGPTAGFRTLLAMVAAPNDDLYVVDGTDRLTKVAAADQQVTALARPADVASYVALALEGSGGLLAFGYHNPSGGRRLMTLGFDGSLTGVRNVVIGAGSGSTDISAILMAPDRSIYLADRGTHSIWRLVHDAAVAEVVAGGTRGDQDHADGLQARFDGPLGLAWFQGRLIIVDGGNRKIRSYNPGTGSVATVAGGGVGGDAFGDGTLAQASFRSPARVVAHGDSLYVTDDRRVRWIQP